MFIRTLQVAGFHPAVQAMRLPLDSGDRSDTNFDASYSGIGPKDHSLSMKLIQAGSSHRKHIRLIDAWLEIEAPLYWWKEFDTYRFGVDKVSESTMHTITKYPFKRGCFETAGMLEPSSLDTIVDELSFLRNAYLAEPKPEKKKQLWKSIICLLPESFLQTRIVKCSYEALRAMYHDRKNHKLWEWRFFCEYLTTLPYSSFITEPEFTSGYSPDDYLKEAMRTCSFADDEQNQLRHAVFGLASEAGEVAGILQKVYQGHDFDRAHLLKELGDCQWMIAEACDALHASLTDDVMKANIEKLKARYPDGFDPEKSRHRAKGDI